MGECKLLADDGRQRAVGGLEGFIGGSVLVHCVCHLIPPCGVRVRGPP